MAYDVNLDLEPAEVKKLKQIALDLDLPMRGLLTEIARIAIKDPETAKKQIQKSK
jgi:hypothetical protein